MRIGKFPAIIALCAAAVLAIGTSAYADLSAKSAFTLTTKVSPGTEFKEATGFLGKHSGEWTVDEAARMKVRRWGTPSDEWYFDVLHNGTVVRATRIIWVTKSRRDQQHKFSQLTTEGKRFFGVSGKFKGSSVAEWTELEDALLINVTMGDKPEDGVTMLTGIRNDKMESAKYGF